MNDPEYIEARDEGIWLMHSLATAVPKEDWYRTSREQIDALVQQQVDKAVRSELEQLKINNELTRIGREDIENRLAELTKEKK